MRASDRGPERGEAVSPRDAQLAARGGGPIDRAEALERLQRSPQVHAGIRAPPCPAQPFAQAEQGARLLEWGFHLAVQPERLIERLLERVVRQKTAATRRDGARTGPVGTPRKVLEAGQRSLGVVPASRAHKALDQIAAGEHDARLLDASAGEGRRNHLEVGDGRLRPPPTELEEAEGRAPPGRDRGAFASQAPPDLGGLLRRRAAVNFTCEARLDARLAGQGQPAGVDLLERRCEGGRLGGVGERL